MFLGGETALLIAMDAAVAELVEPYKNLKPKIPEPEVSENEISALKQLETVTAENEKLKQELEETKNKMQGMIGEFGNMFGGGSDHELAKHEVVAQVKDISEDTPLKADDLNLNDDPMDQK
jgi:hypothetical protein